MELLHRHPTADPSLRSIAVFGDCTAQELRVIARNSLRLERPCGGVLFREHEIQRELVALVSGTAIVSVRGIPIGVAHEGDCLGGAPGIGRQPWSATGVASQPSIVLVLSFLEVAQLTRDLPRLAPRLLPADRATTDATHRSRVPDGCVAIDPARIAVA